MVVLCCVMLMLLQNMIEEDQGFLVHHSMWNMATTV